MYVYSYVHVCRHYLHVIYAYFSHKIKYAKFLNPDTGTIITVSEFFLIWTPGRPWLTMNV